MHPYTVVFRTPVRNALDILPQMIALNAGCYVWRVVGEPDDDVIADDGGDGGNDV